MELAAAIGSILGYSILIGIGAMTLAVMGLLVVLLYFLVKEELE